MTRRKAAVLGLAAAIVASGLLLVVLSQQPAHHVDGQGPLGSRNGEGSELMAIDAVASGASAWTYGLRLCLASGKDPASLERVGPTTTTGTGFQFVGAGVRTFVPTTDETPIISVDGYPPPSRYVPDTLGPVEGYPVATPCSNGPDEMYTELLVGLQKVGDDGGGWNGLDIDYTVNGRHYVLAVRHDLLICGRSFSCDP